MSNASALFRSLIIYGLCLPLAVTLGYLLANPLDLTTVTVVLILLFILIIPLLLRWHHVWLIAVWNSPAVLFFLPGRPGIRIALAAISFTIGVLQYTLNRNMKFLQAPLVTRPLLFFAAVVLITMRLTGGIGLRTFGSSSYGGRNYIAICAAVIGFFAFISRRIPPGRGRLYVALFFFGMATMGFGDLPVVLPRELNFLFLVFPLLDSGAAAMQGASISASARISGLAFSGLGLIAVMLSRYGIRGIFLTASKPWRAVLFVTIAFITLMGGFRSAAILILATFLVLFFLERLHHTRMLPVLVIAALLGGTLMITFAERLPLTVQRSLAFLPINIDPVARMNAAASSAWRLQIWRDLLPQIPQYLILGKGYSFSARDLAMIRDNVSRTGSGVEGSTLVGDYHNGPLSVLIPFGIFGMVGFLWFLWAGLRVTYLNYQFGDPAYREANTYLFAFFLVKTIFFFTVFGGLASDFLQFAGIVGLSVSLNGGVAKPAVAPQPKMVFNRFRLHPSIHRPVGV